MPAPKPWAHIDDAVKRYCAGFDRLSASLPNLHEEPIFPAVILLTGSTGNIGSYLLSKLVPDERVDRVYCLNRVSATGANSKDRQRKTLQELGLSIAVIESPKVTLLEGDITQDKLGLADDVFAQVNSSVTVIIHNAWIKNFHINLASFESNLSATRKLLEVSLTMPHAGHLRFLFASSIVSVQSWPLLLGEVREDTKVESRFAVGTGYGEAKHVAEKMLESSGLNATSLRIGQVVYNSWAVTEWFPIMIRLGVRMGSLPTMPGLASWLPIEGTVDSIIDVMFMQRQPPPVVNLYHPRPTTWLKLMQLVRAEMKSHQLQPELSLVPFSRWLQELEYLMEGVGEQKIKSSAAVKLLPLLRRISPDPVYETEESGGYPSLNCDKMKEISPSFTDMQQLGKKDVEAWVSYWASQGMFRPDSRTTAAL